jgi:transcriptional regulator with GAF, ATPase, and Fis domain
MPEARLGRAVVNLADALVSGYEVLDFLYLLCDRSSDVLVAEAAALILADNRSMLHLSAASTEERPILDLFADQCPVPEGPCHDAFTTGKYIIEEDLKEATGRWPNFAQKALETGFRSVCAFPLHLRDDRVGVLVAFRRDRSTFDERDIHVGQALADVATIGVVHELTVRQAYQRSKQLQEALESRVLIEQAKGVLAERHGVDVGTAFDRMRRYARNNSLPLREVCHSVIDGTLLV